MALKIYGLFQHLCSIHSKKLHSQNIIASLDGFINQKFAYDIPSQNGVYYDTNYRNDS